MSQRAATLGRLGLNRLLANRRYLIMNPGLQQQLRENECEALGSNFFPHTPLWARAFVERHISWIFLYRSLIISRNKHEAMAVGEIDIID